jgi:hypothetical protein
MAHPLLRLFDGFDGTSPELRGEVIFLQTELQKEGLPATATGHFDAETESALKRFQLDHYLLDDGIAGPLTWAALLGTPAPDLATHVESTMAPDNSGMNAQFAEATKYKAFIDASGGKTGFAASILGGLGSRESGWGLLLKPAGPGGTGDFAPRAPNSLRPGPLPPDGQGYGRGLMQIDFDAFPFARSGTWQDPAANIAFGCTVLKQSFDLIQRKSSLAGRELLRAAIAGYNCGPGRVLKAIAAGRDVDFFTAHRNYSADVVNRAGFFQMKGWA